MTSSLSSIPGVGERAAAEGGKGAAWGGGWLGGKERVPEGAVTFSTVNAIVLYRCEVLIARATPLSVPQLPVVILKVVLTGQCGYDLKQSQLRGLQG